jgi:hypothetical protein
LCRAWRFTKGLETVRNPSILTTNVIRFPLPSMTAASAQTCQPEPADRSSAVCNGPAIDLHRALIRGLRRSTTTKLRDGRVVLEVLLDCPDGRPPEILQILMHEDGAESLGRALLETASDVLEPDLRETAHPRR